MFSLLSEQFNAPGTIKIDREYPLNTAMEFENKTLSFYEKAIAEMTISPGGEAACQVLKQIAEQEKNHIRLIDSLKDFQRHPHEWLENAEWYHLDEY